MKYPILLSKVSGRHLLRKLSSNNLVLLEAALFLLPLSLAYYKHLSPRLKPVGPDELGNSLFIRLFSGFTFNMPCNFTLHGCMVIPAKRLTDHIQSHTSPTEQAELPSTSLKKGLYFQSVDVIITHRTVNLYCSLSAFSLRSQHLF